MALPSFKERSGFLTCRQILNIMVIFGFMFNYMLRVNMTIAIVDMIETKSNSSLNSTEENTTDTRIKEKRFDWDETQKNEILGIFFWGYVLTELPGGRMAEVVGAKRVFGGGMLAASILTLLTPLASYTNYYLLLALRILLGFFLGATWPAIPPMAAKWIPPTERSKFIANMMASSLGAAITMPLCGLLIAAVGWASVFYVTGVIGVVWSVLWFVLIYDSPAVHPRISVEEKVEIETKIFESEAGKGSKPKNVPWKQILLSGPVWAIIICHGCSVFGYFTIVNQLPSYMKAVLHFKIKKNGFLSSLPYLGKYLMAITTSYFADRLLRSKKLSTTKIRKIFTGIALLIPGVLMVIQAVCGNNAVISVTIFTASLFFNGAVTAGYLANGLDIAPNFSGTIMGLANTLSSFGGWLSTKIVALLTKEENTFEQWRYVFWMLVCSYIAGVLIYTFLGTGKLQKWNSDRTNQVHKSQELMPMNVKPEEESKEA